MKRSNLALAAASALMGAASITHDVHAGPLNKRRMSDRDNIGAKNGTNCADNGMPYNGGGSGGINRGDGQSKNTPALKAKDLGYAAVPTSLLAAAAKNSTTGHVRARC